jgi:hypothetical protein
MANFHFDLSLKLSQGEVHDFSGEVQKFSGEVQKFSGEVQNDLRGGANLPTMLITKCYEIFITAHPSAIEHLQFQRSGQELSQFS